MRRALTLILLAATACGDPADKPGATRELARPKPADTAVPEAQELGRELFGVMDRVMAYRSSHYSQLPKDLPAAGIDSLTKTTIRRLSISAGVPTVTVVFRAANGHALSGCSGTNKVLEDSMLNGGAYEITCTLRSGETQAFTVGG